jgi:hypothetical protein
MTTPQEVQKLYNKTHPEMLEDATVKETFAAEDITKISDFDTKIDLPFLTLCGTRLTAAKAILTDEMVMDQVMQMSQAMKDLLNGCRNGFQDVKHFVEKAFPNDKGVKKEFGYDDYEDARKSQPKMIVFMKMLATTVGKYSVQLTDQGMPATLPTRITNLAKDIETANKEQEVSKSGRTITTQERINAYNAVWKDLQVICSAGKRAHINDYARYRRYILYTTNQQPPVLPDEYDVLPAGQTATALTEFTTVTPIVFINAGETDLRFFRHTVEDAPNGDLGFVLTAGAQVVKDIQDVPGTGDFINVTNLSTDKEGLYLVRMAE